MKPCMPWLDEIEEAHNSDESYIDRSQIDKLIAAVRLATREAKSVSDKLSVSTSDRVITMAQITSLFIRLRSGEVEERVT